MNLNVIVSGGALVSMLAAGCSGPSPDELGQGAAPLSQAPTLRMPFPEGEVHHCTQGNHGSTSHHFTNTEYGLDFRGNGTPIVAALAGRVAFVENGCKVGDKACGGGFGNHVRLEHGGQYFTLYGHLGSVTVSVGDIVGRGHVLGLVGNTGNTTAPHAHFSLHHGDASAPRVAPSVPSVIRARDNAAGGFSEIASEGFVCDQSPSGHDYASDNVCAAAFDSPDEAKPLTNNTPYSGETCAEGDSDYFSFGGGTGAFSASATSTDQSIFDCSCAILDANGAELPLGGNEGYTRDDAFHGNEGCACSLANASSDVHYLKIYSKMPGNYVLQKTLPAGAQ